MLDLLIESKQEFPSWLESVAADGRAPSSGRRGGKGRYGGGSGGNFGSRDYRQQSGGGGSGGGMQRNQRSGGGGGGSSNYGNNGYGNGGQFIIYKIHFLSLAKLLGLIRHTIGSFHYVCFGFNLFYS